MAFNTKVRGTEQLVAATVTDTQLDAPNANTGTFGDATHVGQFTVAASGRITAAASVAITATVAGSGTTGKIPKWSSSTALTDSVMAESSGNIGISTTAPLAVLEVVGVSQTPSDHSTHFELSTGTGVLTDNKLVMGVHDGDYSWIQAVKSGTAYRNLALNPSGGTVGVGTSTPSAQLEITKTFRATAGAVSTPASGVGIEVYCQSTNTGSILVFDRTGIAYKPLQIDASLLELNAGSSGGVVIGGTSDPGALNLGIVGKITRYANLATVGFGVPAIVGGARVAGQTANVTIATFTPGADATLMIYGGGVTTSGTWQSNITVTWTDADLGTAQSTNIFVITTGATIAGVTVIRAKASTVVTVKTVNTAGAGTYNAEGYMMQIA